MHRIAAQPALPADARSARAAEAQAVSLLNPSLAKIQEGEPMKRLQSIARKIGFLFLVLVLLYLGLGLGFHFKWKSALEDCRELRRAQGEFVEPEVFGGIIGLFFNVTYWPVYASANIYHDGTPFATPCTHPRMEAPTEEEEIGHVEYVVESFGKRLQQVSLQSPNAVQELKEQYTEFVSPALLEQWTNDVSLAPGRVVSSPWPDRIEITKSTEESSGKYVVTGFIVEVTSMEVVNGGAAAKIPIRITLEKIEGRWLITRFTEGR